MLCRTLLAVAVALFARASPVINQGEGLRIDLPHRRSFTHANGTFDFNKAIIETARTFNKHRQNLINLKANLGEEAFNEGAEIRDFAVLPLHLVKRQSEPLQANDAGQEWLGTVSIGSPTGQSALLDFDTGSSDLWVGKSSGCTGCSGKHTYNPSLSTQSVAVGTTFSTRYADGSTVSGPVYRDVVNVGTVVATGQTFAAVTQMSSLFQNDPIDGILGMAFQSLAQLHAVPFFQNLVQERVISSSVFGFKLSATESSSLYLGGTDTTLYTGSLENHPITSSGYWQISGGSIAVNGRTVVSGFGTIIDSGTAIMYGPPSSVEAVYASIPGSRVYSATQGLYEFPCNSVPNVAFSWGGTSWSISADNFNLGLVAAGSSFCLGALAGVDMGLGTNVWLLGDSFMKNVYTAFDVGNKAVGFATLA
ncbi:Type I transmembrane sorting receptor [Steccherinum ochraceum]|uniref:Type I transmembrane sorting receptor n=1 Tax=Steccherinum ochraceum TaxID=92696 RepID=A0A4R0RX77_9APHY|nr:Type I transmembrane sorting receptor [Steccherinum ochraceum]